MLGLLAACLLLRMALAGFSDADKEICWNEQTEPAAFQFFDNCVLLDEDWRLVHGFLIHRNANVQASNGIFAYNFARERPSMGYESDNCIIVPRVIHKHALPKKGIDGLQFKKILSKHPVRTSQYLDHKRMILFAIHLQPFLEAT